MEALSAPLQLNHHLIARVEARVTGENAHDVHRLLALYHGLCSMADDDVAAERCAEIELCLRKFCATGRLSGS